MYYTKSIKITTNNFLTYQRKGKEKKKKHFLLQKNRGLQLKQAKILRMQNIHIAYCVEKLILTISSTLFKTNSANASACIKKKTI